MRPILQFGKHRVWAVSAFLSAMITPLALFVAPGPAAFLPMMVYAFALGFVESGGAFAPKAIFGDAPCVRIVAPSPEEDPITPLKV